MSGVPRSDLSLKPESLETEEAAPLEYDIAVFPADFTLEVLYQKWKNGEIMMPKFQRAFVWSREQASLLIDSFMMGLPIPPIFLHVLPDQKYNVIDGRQRLESIFYYFEGFFGEPDASGRRRVFTLKGLNPGSRWENKTFAQLETDDKRKFKNCVLRAMVIRQLEPKVGDTSIFYIFERLNTGGTTLHDQEVRNCVYQGKLNDLLKELNTYPNWRRILGKPRSDSRQRDIQLILRYMALFHDGRNYSKPMREFLNRFISRRRNPQDAFIEEERNRFESTCDRIIDTLGDRPFNPHGSLNASVFDAIFVAFARNPSPPPNFQERFSNFLRSDAFTLLTSFATSDTDTVRRRLELASHMLFR